MILPRGLAKPHHPFFCVPFLHPVLGEQIAKAKAILRFGASSFRSFATCLYLCHVTSIRPEFVYLCPDTKARDAKLINFNSKLMDSTFAGFLRLDNPRESCCILPIAVIGDDVVSVRVRTRQNEFVGFYTTRA